MGFVANVSYAAATVVVGVRKYAWWWWVCKNVKAVQFNYLKFQSGNQGATQCYRVAPGGEGRQFKVSSPTYIAAEITWRVYRERGQRARRESQKRYSLE